MHQRDRVLSGFVVASFAGALLQTPLLAADRDRDGDGYMIDSPSVLLGSNGVAFDDAADRAYVGSTYGGITVIEASTHRYLAMYDVSDDVVTPSGIGAAAGKLYLESLREIAVVDAKTGKVIGRIDRPFYPGANDGQVVVSADGDRVYTVNGSSPILTVIDPDDDSVVSKIDIGGEFNRLALSPDGRTAYATNKERAVVAAIDLVAGIVLREVPIVDGENVLDLPCAVAVTPGGGKVVVSYLTEDYEGHVAVFDPTGERLAIHDVGRFSTGVGILPDGDTAVLGSGDLLELSTGFWQARLPVPSLNLAQVFIDARLNEAWVTNVGDRHVAAICCFQPSLRVDGRARIGETLTFRLRLPDEAGSYFQIAISHSMDDGILTGNGRFFPLDMEPLLLASISGAAPFQDWFGVLDAKGEAEVRFLLDEDLELGKPGTHLSIGFTVCDSGCHRLNVRRISNAVTVRLDG